MHYYKLRTTCVLVLVAGVIAFTVSIETMEDTTHNYNIWSICLFTFFLLMLIACAVLHAMERRLSTYTPIV